ncbi:MAG: phosphoenolpyruvate carboxykinase (ATP) [Nitrospinota bacterium]
MPLLVDELAKSGFKNLHKVYRNLHMPELYEQAVMRREGFISFRGPFVVRTGQYTGRSPNDKFIVTEPTTKDDIWWGDINKGISEQNFEMLLHRLQAYWQGKDMFIQDCYAGADPNYRVKLRVVTEDAWHSMFARNMFIRSKDDLKELKDFQPEFTVFNAPRFTADPATDHTRSEAFIIANFKAKTVIIGGTSYGGEIKKSIFSVMNYLLPKKGVLSMHCSANIGSNNDSALFFGLSGTGKTTLSADPSRKLIGDDEHGWSDSGIFNFEGGCYAKVIKLSRKAEPEIYDNTERFGTILENVVMDQKTRKVDLDNSLHTENTRAAYPITEAHVPNAYLKGVGDHPKNIFMLTADAFGVLPPISKLSSEQAMYHFMSGYTAKVAGTERGITEPVATFSTCFGAPFMALHPSVYGKLLGEKIKKHNVKCWLVNTGWTGGPYGEGHRMEIQHSRAMLAAAIDGALDNVEFMTDPIFKLKVPTEVKGVPTDLLIPRNTWKNKEAYDKSAKNLAKLFVENFKNYADDSPQEIIDCNPNC